MSARMLLLAALFLVGCGSPSVEKVIEHESCTTYRLNPGTFSHNVYYVVCEQGRNVRTSQRVSQGKDGTREQAVDTVWR